MLKQLDFQKKMHRNRFQHTQNKNNNNTILCLRGRLHLKIIHIYINNKQLYQTIYQIIIIYLLNQLKFKIFILNFIRKTIQI